MTGFVTTNGHGTDTRNRVIANDHSGTGSGPKSMSALVETSNGHSESVSEPNSPRSGPKTATGTAETARRQRGSVKSSGESALVHETANGLLSESASCETGHATHQTTSGHNVALPETSCHVTGRPGKSESGSGPRKSPQPLESAIVDHTQPRQRSRPREGQSKRAQLTFESERAPPLQPPPTEGREGGEETPREPTRETHSDFPARPRPSEGREEGSREGEQRPASEEAEAEGEMVGGTGGRARLTTPTIGMSLQKRFPLCHRSILTNITSHVKSTLVTPTPCTCWVQIPN